MKQLQFYKYATLGLLVLNLLMISFFIITRGGRPMHHHSASRAIDLLKLNEQQHVQFLASAQKHEQAMNQINLAQSDLLKPYFSQLTTTTHNVASENTLDKIQVLEKRKIEATYQHFEEVKNILTEEQLPDFNIFMDNILRYLISPEKKSLPPSKDS